jgi:hypothetical protein
MAKDKNPLDGIVRFLGAEGFAETIQERLAAHVAPACAAVGVSPADLPRLLDQQVYALMFTCVLEDLMTRPLPDSRNLTDAYVKRHGWKLGSTAKRQLEAVRDSHLGLFEIAEVTPGVGLSLRDLLDAGEPVRVEAPALAAALPAGCPLGARILHIDGSTILSGGILPFEQGMSAEAAEAVTGADDRPAAITAFWLRKTLEEQFAEQAGNGATDSEETDAA